MINRHKLIVTVVLGVETLLALLPMIAKPSWFLERGNDLQEFFKPLLIYAKYSILHDKVIPLWNPLWFGGMPLVSDPQSPISYPFNFVFLIFTINTALFLTIFVHLLLASFFSYKLYRNLGISWKASLVSSFIYITGARYAAALEAGHLGILYAWTWIPAFICLLILINKKVRWKYIVLLAFVSWFLFVSHAITATIVIAASTSVQFLISNNKKRLLVTMFMSICLSILLMGPFILPTLIWQKETTRSILVEKPETYPKWTRKSEFFDAIFQNPHEFDTEKEITVGFVSIIVAILGFFRLRRRTAIIVFLLAISVTLISLNNASPGYSLLIKMPVFDTMRVATRVWTLTAIGIPILCGIAITNIRSTKCFFITTVSIFINSMYIVFVIYKNPPNTLSQVPLSVYENISKDNDFRAYCENGCLSQEQNAISNINTINGYATLIQRNFYSKSWGLFGGYWNYYTLALPPMGISAVQSLKPDLESLGEFNVKYIVNFRDHTYQVRENPYAKGAVYNTNFSKESTISLPVLIHNSNTLKVDTSSARYPYIVVSQTYSPGWSAYTDEGVKLNVEESPSSLTEVTIPVSTKYLVFNFSPPGLKEGLIAQSLAIGLISLLSCYFFLSKKANSQKRTTNPIPND